VKIARKVWIAAAVLAAAGTRTAGAEVARSMTALEARLEPGVEVDVVDTEGRVYRGDFARADGDGVLLTLTGNAAGRRIPAAEVISVSRRGDSLKNGMLIGGGVGALSSLIVFAEDDYYEGECDSSGCKVGVALGVTAFYVGVGALIDHLIKGHELVYRAPPEGLALSVAPYPVRQGAGVRVGLTF